MDHIGYYKQVKIDDVITPDDLIQSFETLALKAELLEITNTPKMLVRTMFSLALEIETNRRNALVIINPRNPEPMTITILAIKPDDITERNEIIKLLRRAGWAVKRSKHDSFVEISVANYEPAIT